MTDLSQLARQLTEAQRRALLMLNREWKFLKLSERPDFGHPLAERWNKPYGGFNYRLTPLGLALRQHILETDRC